MMVSSEELLEKIYREVLAIRERLDSLERRMIPEVEVSARERRLIQRRMREAEEGQTVPWEEVKKEIEERLK
jgi:predicted transcriptional regulator